MASGLGILERRFNIRPKGIVQVGANSGQELPAFRERGIRPVIMVEPLEAPFRALVTAVGDEPGYHPVKACLSDVADKQVEFFVASNGGQSSSYLKPARHLEMHPDVRFDTSEKMSTDTLDRLVGRVCGEQGIDPATFDFLLLDTQGAEFDILKGGPRVLAAARYVFTEISFGNLYEGDTGLYDGVAVMREAGFDLYNLTMSANGWGDALFMRREAVRERPASRPGQAVPSRLRRGLRKLRGRAVGAAS